jgi:hypothetical protein
MIGSTQPLIFDKDRRSPPWVDPGGESPGKAARQPERCAMIEHREGRSLARNGREGRPRIVVATEMPFDRGTMTMCPLVLSEP